jgi:hypothetical protein
LAKLPSSMPVTKVLRTSRSKVTRRMDRPDFQDY